jgi:hypothetical protein
MESAESDILEQLMDGEQILFIARQSRYAPGGSLITPNSVYITNRRVLYRNPKLFGLKKSFIDVDYRDISNIRLNQGIFSTEIFLKSRFLSDQIKLPAVDKKDAKQIGAYIQKGMRTELPGQIITERKTEAVVEPIKTGANENPMEQLKKLGELRTAGILTEEEFLKKKEEILKKI